MKILANQEILGMVRVGIVQGSGSTYEIYVNTNDAGKIPHFHFRDANDWKKFHTCIRIDSASYFLHGEKQDKLNTKMKKILNQFMNTPTSRPLFDEHGNRFNNWQYVCMIWNDNNSDVIIEPDVTQPDYLQLK